METVSFTHLTRESRGSRGAMTSSRPFAVATTIRSAGYITPLRSSARAFGNRWRGRVSRHESAFPTVAPFIVTEHKHPAQHRDGAHHRPLSGHDSGRRRLGHDPRATRTGPVRLRRRSPAGVSLCRAVTGFPVLPRRRLPGYFLVSRGPRTYRADALRAGSRGLLARNGDCSSRGR